MQNFRKFREVPLMSRPSSRSSSDPQNNALLVVAMLAMVAVPAGIAPHTVRIPAPTQTPPADATPYGYTVSLLAVHYSDHRDRVVVRSARGDKNSSASLLAHYPGPVYC